jgi:SAM-dependent methyltransferase
MQDYYAARAQEYDQIYAKPERQADLRALEAWLAPHFAGASVLEVACGTGYWTQFIAPVAARVVAIDAAPETLKIAATRVPPGTVEFTVGDAYALPRAQAGAAPATGTAVPCNAGFAGFWYSHVPQSRVREFLQGLNAALAPGATVVLLDNRFVEGSSTPLSAERDAEGNSYQMRALKDGTQHRVLKNFPTEAELRAAVQGLATDVAYTAWPYFWALAYRTPR